MLTQYQVSLEEKDIDRVLEFINYLNLSYTSLYGEIQSCEFEFQVGFIDKSEDFFIKVFTHKGSIETLKDHFVKFVSRVKTDHKADFEKFVVISLTIT